MLTLKLLHPNGQKETAHFQTLDKCYQWMNLHYKKVKAITLTDSVKNSTIEFVSKHDFEDYYKKQATK